MMLTVYNWHTTTVYTALRQCRRLGLLCPHARSMKQSAVSRASNPYPFPTIARPTPHQIFHLPQNASQADIKARYFDLVRIYHPDKGHQDLTTDVTHARFQSITTAYDILRGKAPSTSMASSSAFHSGASPSPTTTAWRARTRREALYSGGDDRWKDRVILAGVIATVAILVIQTFTTRKQALAEALAAQRRTSSSNRNQQTTGVPADPDTQLSA